MIAFVDTMRDRFGVELVCRVMRQAELGFLTARGYRAAQARPASARQLRDEVPIPEIVRLAGVRGVKRSKKVFTTRPGPANAKPRDLVQRRFTADAPRRLWVADVTYAATWSGIVSVAFVTDVFSRRIVGWNVASTLTADILPLQALDMAAGAADGNLDGLVHHADHGSNDLAVVYTDRIEELGATPSTGTVGDSLDHAMAEAINGLYQTELIRRRGPWHTIEQVELATLEYVWWWNNQHLHGELDLPTPAEVEADYYADLDTPEGTPVSQAPDRNETQDESFPARLRSQSRTVVLHVRPPPARACVPPPQHLVCQGRGSGRAPHHRPLRPAAGIAGGAHRLTLILSLTRRGLDRPQRPGPQRA